MNKTHNNISENDLINYSHQYQFHLQLELFGSLIGKINFYFMSFGLISNTVCIFILSTKYLRKSKFNIYLMILAVVELLFCLTIWTDELCEIACSNCTRLSQYNPTMGITIYFLAFFLDSCAVMITLLISIDRLFAIYHPLKINEFSTRKHIKRVIFFGMLLCFMVRAIEIPLYYAPNRIAACGAIIASIVTVILPAILILIVNTLLFIKLKNYDAIKKISNLRLSFINDTQQSLVRLNEINEDSQDRVLCANYQPMTRTQKSHFVVIITIGIWLLITEIPYNLILWIMSFNEYRVTYSWIQLVSTVFLNSNHCINLFIYIAFHYAFRARLRYFLAILLPKTCLLKVRLQQYYPH